MTRQRTRFGRIAGQAAAGLVTVAAMVLLAPVAVATPESDADAAITAAWDATGGDTGPLGARDGGVYAVGAGFGQNFAAGKVFFTPDTGAHFAQGVILEKYESLGGPADSDLGFPTIDEGPGKAANSRNSTFGAADKPVIFWTPDTGARVVRGAINAAWDTLGGSAGVLGVPTDDETFDGDVVSQKFTGGEVSWNRKTKAFSTTPPELADQLAGLDVPSDVTSAIAAARRAAGGALGPLGAVDGAQYTIGADGVGQNFAGGKVFYSPATGANVVTGQVLAKYESVGGPTGDLGFPTASEADGGLAPASRVSTFAAEDKPVIFWTPDFGAVIVRGAMNVAWDKLGGAQGDLGAPKADQTENGDTITQQFSGGSVSWDRSTHKFSTEPANLQSKLAGVEVPGADVPKSPATGPAASGDKWYTWNWWWLLGVIPLLALGGLIVAAVLRNRRSRLDDHLDHGYGPGDDGGYEGDYDSRREAHHDDEFDSGPIAFGAREQAPYVPPGAPASPWAALSPLGGTTPAPGHPDYHDDDFDERAYDGDATDDADQDIHDLEQEDLDHEYLDHEDLEHEDLDDEDLDHDDIDDEDSAPLGFQSNPDSVDTAPTRIEAADWSPDVVPPAAGAPPAPSVEHEPDFLSGRHAAIRIEEPDPAHTSMRLASGDPYRAPEGYPIKADIETGRYWTPGSPGYDETRAEIWFTSEEFARTNGFVRAN